MSSIVERKILTEAEKEKIQELMARQEVKDPELPALMKEAFRANKPQNGKDVFRDTQHILQKIEDSYGKKISDKVKASEGYEILDEEQNGNPCPDSAIATDRALGLLVNNGNSELLRTYLSFN